MVLAVAAAAVAAVAGSVYDDDALMNYDGRGRGKRRGLIEVMSSVEERNIYDPTLISVPACVCALLYPAAILVRFRMLYIDSNSILNMCLLIVKLASHNRNLQLLNLQQ